MAFTLTNCNNQLEKRNIYKQTKDEILKDSNYIFKQDIFLLNRINHMSYIFNDSNDTLVVFGSHGLVSEAIFFSKRENEKSLYCDFYKKKIDNLSQNEINMIKNIDFKNIILFLKLNDTVHNGSNIEIDDFLRIYYGKKLQEEYILRGNSSLNFHDENMKKYILCKSILFKRRE
jgi:hypothetical protein